MSVFSLCEQALGLVRGRRLILSETEENYLERLNYEKLTENHAQDEAVVCALHFARVRDRLLELHAWKFARKVSTVKSGGDLPEDCVSVLCVCVDGVPVDYEQRGRKLNVDASCEVHYTAEITDTEKWSGLFRDVFCYSLAEEICPSVTGSGEYTQFLEAKVQELLRRAYQTGAIQPETRLTARQELYRRAILLSRGTRTVSGSGNTAAEQGLDVQGYANWRTDAELKVCEASASAVMTRLFEGYAWKFARRSLTLSGKSSAVSGWKYAYEKPKDSVKVLAVLKGSDAVEYEETDGKLYANEAGVTVRYTARIEDISSWTGTYKDVFTYQLAIEAVYATTGNPDTIKLLEEKTQQVLSGAYESGEIGNDVPQAQSEELTNRAIELACGVDDRRPKARELALCRKSSGSIRDRLLLLYAWEFARKSCELSSEVPAPDGWKKGYELPSDCMKAVALVKDGAAIEYEEAGGCVYCNASSPSLRYTSKVTDISKWPGVFADAYVYSLAQELVLSTTKDANTASLLEEKVRQIIHEAERTGAIRYAMEFSFSEHDGIYARALSLAHGQRSISGTSEASHQHGADITGDANCRMREETAICRRSYPLQRDKLLRLYDWGFARATAELKETSRVSGWDKAFSVPEGCMKVLEVLCVDEPVEYELSDGKILSNAEGSLTARYTRAVTDSAEFDEVFREVLCVNMAIEIITGTVWNAEAVQQLEARAAKLLHEAVRMGLIRREVRIPAKEELYNRAISLLKGSRTLDPLSTKSLEDGADITGDGNNRTREELAVCRRSGEAVRDRMFELYAWSFAKATAAGIEVSSSNGWEKAYRKPSDCVRVLSVLVGGEPAEWELSDGKILCNGSDAYVRYIRRVEDVSEWPSVFKEAYCYNLAVEVGLAIGAGVQAIQLLREQAERVIAECEASGSISIEEKVSVKDDICAVQYRFPE